MNRPEIQYQLSKWKLSPRESNRNSVVIILQTLSNKILEDPTTGSKTLIKSKPVSPLLHFCFPLITSSNGHIQQILRNRLARFRWLSGQVASHISTAATNIGFCPDGYVITVLITITYKTVLVLSDYEQDDEESNLKDVLLNLVLGGMCDGEDFRALKMAKESCSICLEELEYSNTGITTRMTCSHVFHYDCLLGWLIRKNSCPLCRTVLYEH